MRHGCEHTVFGSDLDGVRPFRIRRHRPHVFVCAGSVIATVHLSVLTCVVCTWMGGLVAKYLAHMSNLVSELTWVITLLSEVISGLSRPNQLVYLLSSQA